METKCQLDATEVFIADLTVCSTCFGHHYAHHQELKSIIQWLLRVVFCAVVFSSSWSGVVLKRSDWLRPNTPFHCVMSVFVLGLKRPWLEAVHLSPASAEV